MASEATALLRSMAGENPYDHGLTELVGELSTRSELFRTLWRGTMCASTAPERNASTIRWWRT